MTTIDRGPPKPDAPKGASPGAAGPPGATPGGGGPTGKGGNLLAMLVGAVLGALAGFALGARLIIEWHGRPIDLRTVAVMVGAVVGFWVARLVARKR